MGRNFFLLFAVVMGIAVQAARAASDSSYGYGKATIPANQYLHFADLKNLIINQKATSVESALPFIAAKYPEYLKFHTLMYGSFSIQASTFEEPRALVFGPEAKFIFTFNGNENQMGGNSFETVEYSDQLNEFQFREIAFKYEGFNLGDLNIQPTEVAYENENIVVTKPNPAKCLSCHGQNASPIWMTYFNWPGAYGSNDDQLGMSFDRSSWNPNNEGFFKSTNKPSSLGRAMSYRPGVPDAELQGLVRYATAKATHPRYKYLPVTLSEIGAVQYSKGVPFADLDFSAQAESQRKSVNGSFEWPSRPNGFLLSALDRLNQERLIARLERDGLKNVFASSAWKSGLGFYNGDSIPPIASKDVIPLMAGKMYKVISQFKFKGTMPTMKQVESTLRANLADEFGIQRERIYREDDSFGKGAIRLQPWINSDNGTYQQQPPRDDRESILLIKNAEEFYSDLLGLKQWTELDKIAAAIETDDQFLNTAVGILLADRGIDLHDYNMNLRQIGLTFHTSGLRNVYNYLGIE